MNTGGFSEEPAADGDESGGGGSSAEPGTAQEEIMRATYRALCEHGAAELTIQAIADEFEKSKSLIFYHYDSKEDLLASFLAYLLEGFQRRVAENDLEDPKAQLGKLIDAMVFGPDDNEAFQTAMFELRSQAPFKEVYREQFRTNHAYIHDLFEGVIDRGIEEGVFEDIDASKTATMLLTVIDGARTRWIVLGDDGILETTRDIIDEQLEAMLFVDSGEP